MKIEKYETEYDEFEFTGPKKTSKIIHVEGITIDDLIKLLEEIRDENDNRSKIISCCGCSGFFIHTFDEDSNTIVFDVDKDIY